MSEAAPDSNSLSDSMMESISTVEEVTFARPMEPARTGEAGPGEEGRKETGLKGEVRTGSDRLTLVMILGEVGMGTLRAALLLVW